MSQRLINLSPELKRLRDSGYGVDVQAGCLVVRPIPHLNTKREIIFGTLVVKLNLASDDKLSDVNDHIARFAGEIPCDLNGVPMTFLVADSNPTEVGNVKVQHTLSRKPMSGKYKDYFELVTTYVDFISAPAEALDPSVKAKSFPVIESVEEESVFHYTDTASSRAEIDAVSRKLALGRIAILGSGGTGSYVLDLVAKTPVSEIHVFDGDKFSQHNAFRSPGAPSKEELSHEPQKVDYLVGRYSQMHRHIIPHDYFVSEGNVEELRNMSFVFICMDRTLAKKLVITKLEEWGVPFIEVGMGINLIGEKLSGLVRTTTSTSENRAAARSNIPLEGGDEVDEYAKNIQIADLNALNAALAVIKWKKLLGFYADVTGEFSCMFSVASNVIINTDTP